MSKSIVLDWQKNSLMLARASGRMPKATIEKLVLKSVGGTEADSQTAVEALRSAANELSVKGEVTVLVARELVEMRTVQIPKIDPDEMPDVIRFQAQRQFASMTDAWTVDYVLLPPSTTSEMHTALVAAISPTQLAEIDSACSAAGLQTTKISLRPLQQAQMAMDGGLVSGQGGSLVVCVSEAIVDILILRDGKVVQIRTTKLPSENEQVATALAGELRRSIFAASSELDGKVIGSALLIATTQRANEVAKVVAQATNVSVVQFHPESLLAEPNAQVADSAANRITAAAGALALVSSDRSGVIDFKTPKKRPPKKRDTRKYLLPVAAAATVLICGILWYYSAMGELKGQYDAAQTEIKNKQQLSEMAQRRVSEINAIQQFAQGAPNWLDELAYLAEKLPSSEKIMIESPTNFKSNANGIGEISFGLLSDEKNSVTEFHNALHNDNYNVTSRVTNEMQKAEGRYKIKSSASILVSGKGWDLNTPPHKISEADEAAVKKTAEKPTESGEKPTRPGFGPAPQGRGPSGFGGRDRSRPSNLPTEKPATVANDSSSDSKPAEATPGESRAQATAETKPDEATIEAKSGINSAESQQSEPPSIESKSEESKPQVPNSTDEPNSPKQDG